MIIPYKRLPLLCLLILAAGLGVSCSTEQSIPTEAAVDKPIEQQSSAVLENTVVASEDEVLTWDESASKTKSASEKADSNK